MSPVDLIWIGVGTAAPARNMYKINPNEVGQSTAAGSVVN